MRRQKYINKARKQDANGSKDAKAKCKLKGDGRNKDCDPEKSDKCQQDRSELLCD